MSVDLAGLNPPQREAVTTVEGPLLVLAGAGSGKTRVLTHRIAWLLEQGVEPWRILAVTFTNRAAREMQERVTRLLGSEPRGLWVTTFHSACVRILRQEARAVGLSPRFVIYDDDDQLRLIKEICAELDVDRNRYPPARIRARIDRAKNRLEDPDDLVRTRKERPGSPVVEVFRRYEERLRLADAVDFNDLLNRVVEAWRDHPAVLARWQDRFHHLMVDEYQDTNRAQYELIRLLGSARRNVAVVGDDDQSIYGFRGADLRNILDFEKDFPEARVVRLEQNYRSTGAILEVANKLVRHNPERRDKTLWTEAGHGAPVETIVAEDEEAEARAVVDRIRRLLAAGRRPGDFACIYRTHAASRPLERTLAEMRLPYVLVGARRFFERREVRDVLAWLRLVLNPADDMALLRVINVPRRGLGAASIRSLREHAARNGVPLLEAARELGRGRGRTAAAFRQVAELVDGWRRAAPTEEPGALVRRVVEESGYLAMLEAEDTDEARARMANLDELARAAWEADEDASPLERLEAFLDQASLQGQADELPAEGGAITLLTAHLAKGLEFPVVFVVGLVEGSFPHARASVRDRDIQEERRLAYVAMTRARERLFLTRSRSRRLPSGGRARVPPSRFLAEAGLGVTVARPASAPANPRLAAFLRSRRTPARPEGPPTPPMETTATTCAPETLDVFQPGTRVFHPSFGEGTVRSRAGRPTNPRLVVDFDRAGRRTVYAVQGRLEIVMG